MQETTFWELISSPEIKKICIPTIQRDYAQGRDNQVYLRESFLKSLKDAIEDTSKQLTLDFVYGVENKTMFIPLDGQQRLTTLWLLHWFIAYKAGILCDPGIKNHFLKFTYETRLSSSDFCKSLCELRPIPKDSKFSLRNWITQQTWFFHQYKQDPTIMGMVNMIAGTNIKNEKDDKDIVDGLDEIFKGDVVDFNSKWTTLTNTKPRCIKFYKLPVDIKDGDEIYVKMNARGRQLTDFENFKTELVKHVEKDTILGEEGSVTFAAKLDVQWTDIFWKYAWEDSSTKDRSIDEIYFAFIRRFARLECIKKYGDNSPVINMITRIFTSFEPYSKILDKVSIVKLIRIMDRLRNNTLNTISPWGEEFDFIPKYEDDKPTKVTKPTGTQMLLFYGYCCYLDQGEYDEKSFAEWNRIMWNICENRVDKSNFSPTISEIDLLSPYSHNIIEFLSQENIIECDANKEQLLEEQRKSRHLTDYPLIREMEGYAFFKGAIRFLYTGADNKENWENFVTKSANIKDLIPVDGRHTIRQFVPYLPKEALVKIFSENWISNNDTYLRKILLLHESIPYLHNFLLKDDTIKHSSKLHNDIIDLCENAFGGKGYLQTKWTDDCAYIWTDYSRKTEHHGWNSYVVGSKTFTRISEIILNKSEFYDVDPLQRDRYYCKHFKGLYLRFKYQKFFFNLFANETICLMKDNWKDKMPNKNEKDGYYFNVSDIKDENDLNSKLDKLITNLR